MKRFTILFSVLLLAVAAFAQSPAPTPTPAPSAFSTSTFSINLTPVTLPGGKSSVTGTVNGAAITVTPNFDAKNFNLISTTFNYFALGGNYRIPALSKWLNNASPTINGLQLQFYLTGTVGAVKVLGGPQGGHWGETIGGGMNYAVNGTLGLGAEAQYAKFPGYANNTYLVAFGPNFHF